MTSNEHDTMHKEIQTLRAENATLRTEVNELKKLVLGSQHLIATLRSDVDRLSKVVQLNIRTVARVRFDELPEDIIHLTFSFIELPISPKLLRLNLVSKKFHNLVVQQALTLLGCDPIAFGGQAKIQRNPRDATVPKFELHPAVQCSVSFRERFMQAFALYARQVFASFLSKANQPGATPEENALSQSGEDVLAFADVWYNAGKVLFYAGQDIDAFRQPLPALALGPDIHHRHTVAASPVLYPHMQREVDAVQCLMQAVQTTPPSNFLARALLGRALLQNRTASLSQFNDAYVGIQEQATAISTAIGIYGSATHPEMADLWYHLGCALLEKYWDVLSLSYNVGKGAYSNETALNPRLGLYVTIQDRCMTPQECFIASLVCKKEDGNPLAAASLASILRDTRNISIGDRAESYHRSYFAEVALQQEKHSALVWLSAATVFPTTLGVAPSQCRINAILTFSGPRSKLAELWCELSTSIPLPIRSGLSSAGSGGNTSPSSSTTPRYKQLPPIEEPSVEVRGEKHTRLSCLLRALEIDIECAEAWLKLYQLLADQMKRKAPIGSQSPTSMQLTPEDLEMSSSMLVNGIEITDADMCLVRAINAATSAPFYTSSGRRMVEAWLKLSEFPVVVDGKEVLNNLDKLTRLMDLIMTSPSKIGVDGIFWRNLSKAMTRTGKSSTLEVVIAGKTISPAQCALYEFEAPLGAPDTINGKFSALSQLADAVLFLGADALKLNQYTIDGQVFSSEADIRNYLKALRKPAGWTA